MNCRQRRFVATVAVGAGLVLMISAGAFAVSFLTSGGTLGIGSISAECQPTQSPITPTLNYAYNASTPGYVIDSITLSGLNSSCLNKKVKVSLANGSGGALAAGTGATPSSGSSATISIAGGYAVTSPGAAQLAVAIYD